VNPRRFVGSILVTLAITAASASSAGAAESRSLDVVPAAPPQVVASRAKAGLTPRASALTPSQERGLKARFDRRKAFLRYEEELHRAAFKVGPSLSASRRRGWVAPAKSKAKPPGAPLSRTGTRYDPPLPGEIDTVRMAFIRIDFLTDRGGGASTGDGRFNLVPGDTIANPVDPPPHDRSFYRSHAEALSRYFEAQSYGRVHLEIDVWPADQDSAYHLSDMADLGPWTFGSEIFEAAVEMMHLCFLAADSQSIAKNDRIPWDTYDRYTIIHAGGDLQSDVAQNSPLDIPSFTMFVDDTDRVVFPDSSNKDRPIDRVCFVPETINQDGFFGTLNGVIAHENGHNIFGLGDIYDINTADPVVGYWSLMDSGNLLGAVVQQGDSALFAVGLLPPSLDPFQRNFILDEGLLNFRVPGPADTAMFALRGSQRTNDYVKLDQSSDEYVILENRFLAPTPAVRLRQDPITRVILGPREPDSLEYDALLPGGGILAWHVDESVIPFLTSLRVNPDFGFNSNARRRGLEIYEADGLDDLGDWGSPYVHGGPYDPYQAYVQKELSDTSIPSLIPHQGTRPHLKVEFLDDASDTMLVRVQRDWLLSGWPVSANFPPGGPLPLAVDLDRDGRAEVVWGGGDTTVTDTSLAAREAVRDSAALFAIRWDGKGVGGRDTLDFAHLDRRPLPMVAAIRAIPSADGVVCAVTEWYGDGDVVGGKLWAMGPSGASLPGFPMTLASPATTPPVLSGDGAGNWIALVGCADGRLRAVDQSGALVATSSVALAGGVAGQLALSRSLGGVVLPPQPAPYVAAGGAEGEVIVLDGASLVPLAGWPVSLGGPGFTPDFLWVMLGGTGSDESPACGGGMPTLITHYADRVWAHCPETATGLAGWGAAYPDTIVAGLAAGDPDGDGFPEVIVQGLRSQLAFLNRSGRPSPGWPRQATPEGFTTTTPPLAIDLTSDGLPEIVALNASGVLAAFDGSGRTPDGWPLATGVGAAGAMLAADLDNDGVLEVVAPDRFNKFYAYAVPSSQNVVGSPWRMLGGDPGRMSSLLEGWTSAPGPASAGPLVAGSLKAYPNPARRKPVQFAYQLSEDAEVEFRVLNSAGQEVTRWTRTGRRSDNLETWDPSGVPAGLYVARIQFKGPGGTQSASVPVGVIR
jgi:M6 family metalloprotease-like protein